MVFFDEFMGTYLFYASGGPSSYEDNKMKAFFEVYKVRKKYRELRRQEAERRLKPKPKSKTWKFPITIRSFHPLAEFADGVAKEGDSPWMEFLGWVIRDDTKGVKFSGDNRGFSLDDESTVHASMTFEIDPTTGKTNITKIYSDPTRHPILGEATAIPNSYQTSKNTAGYSAGNPLIKFKYFKNFEGLLTPEIDIRSTFEFIREETSDKNYDILKIKGVIWGDDYPNTEAFIRYKSGNKIFLGTDVKKRGFDHIPEPIIGWATTKIMDINLEIKIDENENFYAVKNHGG
jgi:hypothetical protein